MAPKLDQRKESTQVERANELIGATDRTWLILWHLYHPNAHPRMSDNSGCVGSSDNERLYPWNCFLLTETQEGRCPLSSVSFWVSLEFCELFESHKPLSPTGGNVSMWNTSCTTLCISWDCSVAELCNFSSQHSRLPSESLSPIHLGFCQHIWVAMLSYSV